MVDDEVGGDDDRRGRRDRLFVDDAGDRDPPRHPGPLGEQHPPEHVEDAAGHVARQQRLAPGDLGAPEPDRVAEEAQDQVPAEGAEHEEGGQDDHRRDQPADVEVDAFALDLRPLVDDGEDEEAEDEHGEPDLQRQAHAAAARRAGPEPSPGLADSVEEWLAALHGSHLSDANRTRSPTRSGCDSQSMGEFELLAKLRERLPPPGPRVRLGSGDDAAVTVPGGATATSVDAIVDGVHFHRADATPAQIGHKALATALSDLAAMGAEAGEAYVVLGAPAGPRRGRVPRAARRDAGAGAETGTTLAGGDVTAAPRPQPRGHRRRPRRARPSSSSRAAAPAPATSWSSPASSAAPRPACC